MTIQFQIEEHLASLSDPKQSEMKALHSKILQWVPACKLWFDNGLNSENKTVTNPSIGYGEQLIKYANGSTKEFFQIGLSANKTGISIYILGINDKKYLPNTYGKTIGKASVTGYCIKFKSMKDIDLGV